MVESTQNKSNASAKNVHPILKEQPGTEHGAGAENHVHFDEVEIAEYDKTRGQCQKIDDPKTPYHAESSEDEEMTKELAPGDDADPETLQHLEEAHKNRNLNAKQ